MGKVEKAFWIGLLLAAGMVIGALMVILSNNTKKASCNNGMSEQVEDGVRKKTYVPALDTCKEQK